MPCPYAFVATSNPTSEKNCLIGISLLQNQQFEIAFGNLEIVALMLHLLDVLQQPLARVLIEPFGNSVVVELVLDVAAAGKIAQQHALTVADELGLHVLIGRGVLHHRADVDAAFVRERALADERLIVRAAADSRDRR